MESNAMTKPKVFISYSHKDEDWKNRLRPHLGILERAGRVTIWDDRKIDPGGKWFNEIKGVVAEAAVAVCLISSDYLDSDFCNKEEIPYLLERNEKAGLVIIPVLLRPCLWEAVSWLKENQMLPCDGKSVSEDFKDNWDKIFAEVSRFIFKIVSNPGYKLPQPTPRFFPPEKIDINLLPMTGEELFGRQKELEMLDKAWESENIHIVSLVAWGGVGKSTLVNKWLERMAADNYRGAQHVFAWTFHSQGSGEKVTSADLFFSEALSWFGDPDPVKGSPWDKGARLADLIRKKKTLLVLDGLEPLQSPYEYEQGKIRDPGMATMLSELARNNNGLCIITTREEVADLSPFKETTCKCDLEQISAEAGRALLRISGVQGTDAALEATIRDFGYHALALTLLGVYLHKISGHNISHASKILDLDIPESKGRYPRRMMAAFDKRFGEGPEVDLLKILGLFNRPADSGAITALRASPAIPYLTEHIIALSEVNWLYLLQRLRENKLIALKSSHQPDMLDAHPLIREHFGQKLRETWPEAWREGNNRLYEYYKSIAKEYPETIEEMNPLYIAMFHGCQAGRYQEVADEIYLRRIQQGDRHLSTNKLGAIGTDLAALSGFFTLPWDLLVDGLNGDVKAFVLNEVGFNLRALGQMTEAERLMQDGLDAWNELKRWEKAAEAAGNLSELYMITGNLTKALDTARQSVDLADLSGDANQRMKKQTTLADALYLAGELKDAEDAFRRAEDLQKMNQPNFKFLYSRRGFKYCELKLTKGEYQEVLNRAKYMLDLGTNDGSLLNIAFGHLSLGRVHLLQNQQEKAINHMNNAVNGFRQAGMQDFIICGLLARAELYTTQKNFEKARHDLEEATIIAERGGMGLHKADCRLGYARLYLAIGDKDKAREELAAAKEMIGKMGYHRRDKDVEELEAML